MLDLSQRQSDVISQSSAGPEGPPLQAVEPPPRVPSLLSRVVKYALIIGGISATFGAIEGATIGALLAPRQDSGTVIRLLALDRCVLLGLLGAAFGAFVGVLDRYLGGGKKPRSGDAQ
jgi:hypothetical protein